MTFLFDGYLKNRYLILMTNTETRTEAHQTENARLYAASDFATIQSYCAAYIRHLVSVTHVAPASEFRALLLGCGYQPLEIETATARLEMLDELRFATVDGVDIWFGNVDIYAS